MFFCFERVFKVGITKSLYEQLIKTTEKKNELLLKIGEDYGQRFSTTIYGSARIKEGTESYDNISVFTAKMAKRHIDVITGAGSGVMEAANRGVHAVDIVNEQTGEKRQSKSIGVGLTLPFEQKPNGYVEKNFQSPNFPLRLELFGALGLCHIYASEGGIGTLYEASHFIQHSQIQRQMGMDNCDRTLFPVHPSVQLGYIPCVILVGDLWTSLKQQIDTMVKRGFVTGSELDFIHYVKDYDEAFLKVMKLRKSWRRFLRNKGVTPLN